MKKQHAIEAFKKLPTTRLFVYGTLRREASNGQLLSEVGEWEGEHRTLDSFQLHDLRAFPAAVPGGSKPIVGEVFKFPSKYLYYTDKIEGTSRGLYYRKPIVVTGENGMQMAWIYLWGGPRLANAPIIESGDWYEAVASSL
jgi:gamma-glutamylcyclotransferase (GGCT)/AIG2-like uncharacterized protein YtfP